MNSVPAVVVVLDLCARTDDLDAEVFAFTAKFIERFRSTFPIHLAVFEGETARVHAKNVKSFPEELKKAPRATPMLHALQKAIENDLRPNEYQSIVIVSCGTSEYHFPSDVSFLVPLYFVFAGPEDVLDPAVGAKSWEFCLTLRAGPDEPTPKNEVIAAAQPIFPDLYDSLDDCFECIAARLGCRRTVTIEIGDHLKFQVKCTSPILPFRANEKWSGANEGILSVLGTVKTTQLTNIATTCESIYAFRPLQEEMDSDAYTVVAKSLSVEGFMFLCLYDHQYHCLLRSVRSEQADSWELTMQFVDSFGRGENRWQLAKTPLPPGGTSYAAAAGISYQSAAKRNYWVNDHGLQTEVHRLVRSLKREDKVDILYQDINRIGLHAIATSQNNFAPTLIKILENRFSQIVPTMHGHLRTIIEVLRKDGFEGWSTMRRH